MTHFLLPKEAPLYQGREQESSLSRSFIWRFHQKFEHGVFMQQTVNAPKLNIKVDRLKAQELALTAKDVSDNVLLSLSGSGQTAPNFWLDPANALNTQSSCRCRSTAWTASIRCTGRP
jgi:hypothetical protein